MSADLKDSKGKMMRVITLYLIVAASVLTYSACTDLSDVLCRPAGHCPNAPDGLNKDH
jgi:hypothetical protein